MTTPLFRDEVLVAQSTRWAGSIVLSRPVPMRLAAIIAAGLAIALLLYLLFGEYTRKVRVSGQLVPDAGALQIVAPQFGQISRCLVHEGDTVVAGQVLYDLVATRSNAHGDIDARIELSLATRREMLAQELAVQNRQLKQRQASLDERRRLLESELERLDKEVSLQNKRIANADAMLKRYEALRQRGFVSEIQLNQIENEGTEQLARGQALERARLTSKRELLQIAEDADSTTSQIHLNQAQTERSLAVLDQEEAEHQGRRLQILAPAPGIVTALVAEPGQTVASGTNLVTLIPAGSELEAHLFAPSRAIGFVEPDQEVFMQLPAFPYQKFGQIRGRVVRVERSPVVPESRPLGLVNTSPEPLYKVTVKLNRQSITAYGKEHQYRAGMSVDADIRQDRRRLVEWVFDPVLSAAKHR